MKYQRETNTRSNNEEENEVAPGRVRIASQPRKDYVEEGDKDVMYLNPKDQVRMSTFGNVDPFTVRKTIHVPRETLRSGSPTMQHRMTVLNTSKDQISGYSGGDIPRNRSNDNIRQEDLREDMGSRTNMPNVNNSNFNNPNILSYMQPYSDYTYQQPMNVDQRGGAMFNNQPMGTNMGGYNMQPMPMGNNYQQNTHYQRKPPTEGFLMDTPFNHPNYNNSIGMMSGNTYDPNKMNTYDSNIPNQSDFKHDTHKQMNMSNVKDQRSPQREEPVENVVEEDRKEEEQEHLDPVEHRKNKLQEIQYMKDFTNKDKEKIESFVRMMTEESEKEEKYDDVEKLYSDYRPQIEVLTKDDNMIALKQSFIRKSSRAFNPTKAEGKLYNALCKTFEPAKWDEQLQNRNRVIKKFNKLSNIINSKSSHPGHRTERSHHESDDEFDEVRKTIHGSKSEPKNNRQSIITSHNTPKLKFMRISMAMLSSKGPNCEDRMITRDMRFEKGGVVDFAGKKADAQNKYKIKKIVGVRSPQGKERHRYSNRDREKAIKIVQEWWRNLLGKYKSLLYKIVKMQSSWRSYWFRLHMVDIVYAAQMFNTFNDKIDHVVTNYKKVGAFELLKENYAYKFGARLYLIRLLKLQKAIRNWLNIQKDKKQRLANCLEMIFLRRKKEAFDKIKALADHDKNNEDNKMNDLKNLCIKTKKNMRIAVFHDFLFGIFNKPINVLKGKLFTNTLKNNLRRFHLLFKREFFMRWLKKCLGGNDYKYLGADNMYKAIMRPQFRALTNRMKALPPKDLKDRVLKMIMKNYEDDSDKKKAYYLRLWSRLALKLEKEDFVNNLNAKLCMKTAKKMQDNKLRAKFRFWRDSVKSKKDLRPFINGLPGMDNFVKKAVADKVMAPLRSSTKGIQSRTAKELLRSNKFHLLPLRHYWKRWRDYVAKTNDMDNRLKFLLGMKDKGMSKIIDRALLRRFWDWRRKVNLAKLKQKMDEDDTSTRKYFALVKLMSGTEKLAKRKALQTTLPPIYAWLVDQMRQRATKDLLFMFPKLNRITLRNYWRKWNKQNDKLRQKEVRDGFFANLSGKANSKIKLRFMRKYLLRWWRNLPKNLDIKYFQGAEKLRAGVHRTHLKKPVEAFKQKILLDNAKNGMQHAFGLKDKFIKRHWRDYFIKWWKICGQLKAKEANDKLAGKVMLNFSDKFRERILLKWWRTWKKIPKINLNDIYDKFKNGADLVNKTVNRALQPARKHFMDNVKDTQSKPFVRKVIDKLMGMATQGNDIKLRHYLWRWHVQCKNHEIYDLKKRLMKTNINNNKERIGRNEKYHFFNLWKTKLHGEDILKHSGNNLNIYEALAHINKVKTKRENDFWIRMNRLMNLDHRGQFLNGLKKRLLKSRYDLGYAFMLWKKKKQEMDHADSEKDRMVRLLRGGTNKFKDRLARDSFIRAFHLWSRKAKIPQDYYQRIIDGKNKVNNYLKSKLQKPYNEIIDNKNYGKLLKSCLPANSRLAQRDKHDNLLRLWNVWKKNVHHQRLQEHRALLVGKLADKHLAVRDMNSKGRAFRLWAGIKKPTLQYPDVVEGTKIIDEVLKKPHRQPIIDALKGHSEKKAKGRVLRSGHRRKKNNNDLRLKAILWTWRNKANKLAEQEFKNKVIANNCKNISAKSKKNDLYRAFWKWNAGKEKLIPVYDYRPTRVALETIRKVYEKEPWEKFKDKTKMMNLHIPYGMNLSHALIRMNPHVCKSLALRNISLRKPWKLWKANVKQMQNDENRDKLFSKILNVSGINIGKTALRVYLRLWKKKVDDENAKNEKNDAVARWAKSVYGNNLKFWKKKCLRLWKANLDKYMRDLGDISHGVRILNNRVKRPHWQDFVNYGRIDPNKVSKFLLVKKMMLNSLRNSDKGNLFYAFQLWKKARHIERENDLKIRILRNLASKNDKFSKEALTNKLHEKFLKWRIVSNPHDYLQTMNNIRVGTHLLHTGLIKKYNNDIIPRLKKAAKGDKAKEALYKLLSGYDDKARLEYLRIKFKWWRIRVGDTEKMKKELKDMVDRWTVSPVGHKKLVEEPKNDLVDAMKTWHKLKTDKAKDIQDYCKSLLFILQKMKNMKRNKLIHNKFAKLSKDDYDKVKAKFILWRTNAQKLKQNDAATTIQNFARTKMGEIQEKKDKLNEFTDHTEKFLKLYSFNNIYKKAQDNKLRDILVKNMEDIPEEVKKEYLKKYYLRWWKALQETKEEKAANLINNKARAFRSGRRKKKIEDQRDTTETLMKKLYMRHADKLQGALQLWRANAQKLKQLEDANKIQSFIRPGLNKAIKENAHDDLYRLIKKKYISELKKTMGPAGKIKGDRGEIMYETLYNMYWRLPFDKLKQASKWIGIIRKMRDVCPLVHHRLRTHFLPPRLKLWHTNTVGMKQEATEKYNNWIKEKEEQRNEGSLRSKNRFFEKHFQKLDKKLEIKKRLKFKLWNKQAKIMMFSDMAQRIQAVRRGNVIRDRYRKQKANDAVEKLTIRVFMRHLVRDTKEIAAFHNPLKKNLKETDREIENRYGVNNLVNIANNDYRNKMMETLTGKKCFNADLLTLRFWFNKWKGVGDKMEENALKLQNNFRSKKAKKKAKKMREVYDNLSKAVLKYSDNDNNKLKIAFRLWAGHTRQMKVDEDGAKIRKFCRNALDKNKIVSFQNNFVEWAKKLAKKRISDGIKTDNFKMTLRKVYFPEFLKRLKNKDKFDKLQWTFLKRFGTMDDDMKKLYMKKYLRLWKIQAHKIAEKELDSAKKIQTNFRSSNVRRKVNKERGKSQMVNKMLMKLWTRMVMKKQIALRLWKTNAEKEKAEESSNKIQGFCRKGQDRLRSKNRSAKQRNLDNFVKTTMKKIDECEERPVFKKIKEEADRKKFSDFVDNLEKKKDDHLKTAVDNIKNYGDMKHDATVANAKKIQLAWKKFKQNKRLWDFILRLQKMRRIVKLMMDKNARVKYLALRLWKKNMIIPGILNSAKKIQDFCREKILIPRYQKKPVCMQKTQDLLRNNLLKVHILPFLKDLTNTIKLDQFILKLRAYAFKKLKYNIDNRDKLKTMNQLFKLPKKTELKILKKWLWKLKDQTEKKKRSDAAKLIQKNFRLFNQKNKDQKIYDNVNKRLMWLHLRNENIKDYYFLWWRSQAMKIKQHDSATIIQKFTRKEWDRIRAKNNWWRLADSLHKRDSVDNGLALIHKYKLFKKLDPMVRNWDLKLKRIGFDGIKDNGKLRRIGNLVKSMFDDFENRGDILQKNHYFRLWRINKTKLHNRDIQLEKMVKAIDERDKIGQAKTIGDAMLMKKLGKLTDTIRAKDAMKNLKWKAANQKKLHDLAENLQKGKKDLENKTNDVIKDKLFKLYVYKVLDKMNKKIDDVTQYKLKPFFGKHFVNQLKNNLLAGSKDEYNNKKRALRSGKPKNLRFNGNSINAKKSMIDSDYDVEKVAIPAANKILKNLFDDRKQWAFKKLKDNDRDIQFRDKLRSHVRKTAPLKEEFEKLKQGMEYLGSKPDNKEKLRKMFRMSFIKKLKTDLEGPAKLVKQRYLIRLAFMHKNVNDKRTYREIVRKWRFHVMMKMFMKKKAENAYKQMHLNYLNMVKDMMGEDEADGYGNGSVAKEVDGLCGKMGMYKYVDPNTFYSSYSEEKGKMYYIEREEDNENIDDDNPDLTADSGLGGGRYGRYNEDTVKSQQSKAKK